MTLFERIKETGKKRGWNVKQVAAKAGIGENAIYRWKDSQPTADKLKAVADVLGVSVDYLLGNTDVPTPAKDAPGTKQVDLDDDEVIMTFEGRPIPPEDVELMRRLLRGSRDGK